MTLSEAATAIFNVPTPVSEKKRLCVNDGSRTKYGTQIMTPLTASRLLATRLIDAEFGIASARACNNQFCQLKDLQQNIRITEMN